MAKSSVSASECFWLTLFLMSSSSAARMSARLPVTCSLIADKKAASVLPDISSVITPPLHVQMLL